MLTLPIKREWFYLILSGEKKEEYREIKPFYTSRFLNTWGYPAYWGEKRKVKFRNGYSSGSPSFTAECTLSTGCGKEEWGAKPGVNYYVLRIIQIEEVAA